MFAGADLIVKVKEPIPAEYHRFREGQQLFTYLHLAADKQLTEFLLEREIDSIAYETVQTPDRRLPLLTPMSEVAGRMAVQAAAHALESPAGGRRHPARRRARHPGRQGHHHRRRRLRHRGGQDRPRHAGHRPGARHQPGRLAYLSDVFGGRLDLVIPNRAVTAAYVAESDVVIGAVLVPGAKAPKLVSREMIARHATRQRRGRHRHRPGRLLRDQPADDALRPDLRRGGRRALLRREHPRRGRPHLHPRADRRHPALPGPGRRPGRPRRRQADASLAKGLSTVAGELVNEAVAEAHDLSYRAPDEVLSAS